MRPILFATLLMAGCSSGMAAQEHQTARHADAAHPVVVELYQSQGCSSCPPADAVLNSIAGRPDVLALNFAVTYWDNLGWKDTFAKPQYTARQWEYAHAGGRGSVATPQVIINGGSPIVGSRKAQVDQLIAQRANASGPDIEAEGGKVTVASGKPHGAATVWLVRYDPRSIDVAIRAGENGGRTIAHKNIVKQLVSLGQWTGAAANFAVPNGPAGLKTAVFVQQGKGGPIVSARKL